MRAALFIMRATNSSLVFTFSLKTSLFIHSYRQKSKGVYATSNSYISTPTENWTHVYMNKFTRNSPYYHLLNYLLFFLKHHVFMPDVRRKSVSTLVTMTGFRKRTQKA
jgi:hypothetical protein